MGTGESVKGSRILLLAVMVRVVGQGFVIEVVTVEVEAVRPLLLLLREEKAA